MTALVSGAAVGGTDTAVGALEVNEQARVKKMTRTKPSTGFLFMFSSFFGKMNLKTSLCIISPSSLAFVMPMLAVMAVAKSSLCRSEGACSSRPKRLLVVTETLRFAQGDTSYFCQATLLQPYVGRRGRKENLRGRPAAEVFLDVRSILAFYATTSNSAWSAASESEPTHKSKTATS